MTIKQLSIFLENKPGALSTPCRLLADAGINIQSLSLADTREFGILRVVVHEWEQARDILQRNGLVVKVTDVVALEVADQPGGLAAIVEVLEKAKINVEYMYAFTEKLKGKGVLAFRFDNPEAALKALKAKKIGVVTTGELAQRLAN